MSRTPRPPKAVQRQFFAALRGAGVLKSTALGAHYRACGMGEVSRVSRQESGELHLRFDELDELLWHLGPDAGVALDWLCSRHGHVAVPAPSNEVPASSGLMHMALRLEAETGHVSEAIADAMDPDGDGGEDVTDAERELILQYFRQVQLRVTSAMQALGDAPVRRVG